MSHPNLTAAALLAMAIVAAPAVPRAEHHVGPPSTYAPRLDEQPADHHRRGEMSAFGDRHVPERPFPWRAVGLAVFFFLVASPFAYRAYKSTSKDLAELKTVGRATNAGEKKQRGEGKARAAEKEDVRSDVGGDGATARDRVWDAVSSVDQWVPVDWVARTAGISVAETTEELNLLAEEGHLEHARDRSGRPIFRVAAG